jgi:hypothetical protein
VVSKINLSQLTCHIIGVIIFCSVRFLSKKITKLKFLKKKTKTDSNRPVSVRFDFFRIKTGSKRFRSFFSGFFLFGFSSVWFFRF